MIDRFSIFATKSINKRNSENKITLKKKSIIEKSNNNLDQDILNSLLRLGNKKFY
jgi:hypothetical protein